MGYSPRSRKESDTTEVTAQHKMERRTSAPLPPKGRFSSFSLVISTYSLEFQSLILGQFDKTLEPPLNKTSVLGTLPLPSCPLPKATPDAPSPTDHHPDLTCFRRTVQVTLRVGAGKCGLYPLNSPLQ